MLSYYGWIEIRESYSEEGESDILMQEIWTTLQTKAEEIQKISFNCSVETKIMNGEYKLIIFGASNHKRSPWYEILELLEWLAQNSIGSYGLLYLQDNEDKDGFDNQFQVYVLKKGILTKQNDPFLSPCIPEVEE